MKAVRPPMKLYQPPMRPRRGFGRDERRIFCRCELCRSRFGRLLYPSDPRFPVLSLGWRRRKHPLVVILGDITPNEKLIELMKMHRRIREASATIGDLVVTDPEARAFYEGWSR